MSADTYATANDEPTPRDVVTDERFTGWGRHTSGKKKSAAAEQPSRKVEGK